MVNEEVVFSDAFVSEDEMMTPLIDWTREENTKDPDPNEKSILVGKQSIFKQENVSQPLDVVDIVGKTGLWQIKILILSMFIGLPQSWNHLGMSFLAYPVDHWCARPTGSNVSLELWLTDNLPTVTVKGKIQHSQCDMYFYNETTNSAITSRVLPCYNYEYASDFNSLLIKWNIVCDKDWILSTSQTVYMMGFLVSSLVSGHFADKFGRRPAILINIVICIVAGFAAAFSSTFIMFTISRFFIAFGQSGLGLVIYILLFECIGSEYRVLYVSLHGIGWHVGYLVLPLIAWSIQDWFLLQLIFTVPSIVFLSYYWFVPESPRWLLINGKIDYALLILENAVKTNGRDTKDLENQAKLIAKMNFKEDEQSSTTTFIDLLRTPNLRSKTLYLYFIWAVIAFSYYGLSLNTNDLDGNLYLNFFLSGFMEIPATLYLLVTLNRFGRKKPFFVSFLIGGLACFACIFIPSKLAFIKIGLAMVGKMFISANFGIVYIFSSEIFPTVARNVGVGSSSTVARIGSAVAPFMRDLGNATDPSVPLTIFGVFCIISALIVLKLPETNNQPIPESFDQAEKFGQKENIGFDVM